MTAPLRSLLFLVLLGAGLLAPGWLLGRALRTPAGPAGAFLGSAALLLNLLLALDAFGVALTSAHVAAGIGVMCGALAVAARLRAPRSAAPDPPPAVPFRWQPHHWLVLPVALGFAAVAFRATVDPLSGFDTLFRWDFLARQMLREGTLHFYPPVTAPDFWHYGWCDGIAPLVSSLYFWAYLSAGRVVASATIPVVAGQAALLSWLVYQLGRRHGGAGAGWTAAAVLATSCVVPWGIAIGQETGLTALALVAMFHFLERGRDEPGRRWLIWAGLAAGTGALAREYGLAFLLFGAFTLAWRRAPRRGWIEFVAAAVAVALPWYLRNWIRTGNPLYNFNLAGLFPTNPVGTEYLHVVNGLRGLGTAASRLSDLAILLGSLAAVPLVAGFAGLAAMRRSAMPWLAAILGVAALWLWSVGQTSGGPVYALRVLTPAIALAAVPAGILLARGLAARGRWILIALLSLLALDAGERSLFMPVDPYVSWWRFRASAWRDYRQTAEWWNGNPAWTVLANAAAGRKILVTDPFAHALFTGLGARPVPVFSPEVRFLFAADANYHACLDRLRSVGVRFILVARNNEINDAQASRHPFFRALLADQPIATPLLFRLYDLDAPSSAAPEPAGNPDRSPHAH